jgi:hypothetical protein
VCTLVYRAQRGNRWKSEPNEAALYSPGLGIRERQGPSSVVVERCLYMQAVTHLKATAAIGLALLMSVVWWLFARSRDVLRQFWRYGGREPRPGVAWACLDLPSIAIALKRR